jgi:hypothetical protein
MNPTLELYQRAMKLGLRLEPRGGDKLAVIPANRCPPEFADTLRQHKQEILSLLESQAAGLTPDCAPWLHVAKQILAGEFVGADSSTAASLKIGLRSIRHPLCVCALARLNSAISGDGWKV